MLIGGGGGGGGSNYLNQKFHQIIFCFLLQKNQM
jgi:hypothetical protein